MISTSHRLAWQLARRPDRQRGIAALTVVMVLFFVMAMVAAYTNRNLIFEQRIATNSYRANRALQAVDGGVEWTLAQLNGGRINANCQPSTTVTDTDFRRRYHTDAPPNANGEGGYDTAWADVSASRVYPACVNRDGVLSCICPTMGQAAPAIGGVADGLGSAFRVEFIRPGNAVRPGAMEFATRGCASVGDGNSACTSQTHDALPTVDGLSGALTTVGLVRALPIAPIAPLTAGTSISITGGGTLNISNPDAATGLAAHAANLPAPSAGVVVYQGPAGSSVNAWWADPMLTTLRAEANDGWFRKMFGMDPATYQLQPAVRRVDCSAGCNSASLSNVLSGYPRNPIWVAGDLDLNTAGSLGTATDPVMLIVTGQLTISADIDIIGFVHANNIVWAAGAAAASVRGAMVAKDGFAAAGLATLDYDRAVLDIISLRYGSFVRAPGSWNLIFR
jgi:PilX N-terminal